MGTPTPDQSVPVDILLLALPILAKGALFAAAGEPDWESRASYRRLQAWFILLEGELDRVKDVLHPDEEHMRVILDRLGRFVVAPIGSDFPLQTTTGLEKLHNLLLENKHSSPGKISQQLDFSSQDFNEEAEAIIREVFDFCQMRYPHDSPIYTDDPPVYRRKRIDPPYDVWRAAQSVFEVLKSTKKCICDPTHLFDARLSLATYRSPDPMMGSFRFEMILSLEHIWQEVKIGTIPETAIKIFINDGLDGNTIAGSRKEILHLCKPMRQIRKQPQSHTYCLKFDVEKGVMWNKRPEKRLLPLDLTESPVSLEEFILTRGHCLTEMAKRILAVLLGHTALHLHGTNWMRQDWGSSHVVFLQISSTVPIKPYMEIKLTEGATVDQSASGDDKLDDEDYFREDFYHPFPHFISLGMMLIQVYLRKTIQFLAQEFDFEDPESLDNNHKFVLASQVFLNYSPVIKFSEKYWLAVERCLDPNIQTDGYGHTLSIEALRKRIYDDVISPLEDELEKGSFLNEHISESMWQSKGLGLAMFDDQSKPEDISERDPCEKMRIAILDTGLDMEHPDLVLNEERQHRVRGTLNFTPSASQFTERDVRDASGHGTHAAGFVLDFAPDIISMSFGFNSREPKDYDLIEQAIEYAYGKNVLIFAAASNSGANQLRTFPARHDSVIAIHSTTRDGVPSRFNPPSEETDNFATIGEAVESLWPVPLCNKDDNESCIASKSGTSFATPIAVGIAAFVLQYAKETLDPTHVQLLKKPRGMRAALKEISRTIQGYDYVALKLHSDHLFGKDYEYVKQRLSSIIQHS
ncbi:hypothetical protein TruAng_006649 [Truncatella angustata]|nr:hypothetical protein TruAng_006649 [Truncatella angustata]